MTVTVFAHGCWDGLHIGHIRHLEQARALGDQLVVGVTSDRFVGKGPGRPRYGQGERERAIAALRCVDLSFVLDLADPCEWLRENRPDIYVKGIEYERRGIPEVAAVASYGGRIEYVGETLGSSSAEINAQVPQHPFLAACREKYTEKDVIEALAKIAELRVHVIGDQIVDQYVRCRPLGLTSKGSALSVEVTDNQVNCQSGGASAIVAHAQALRSRVSHRYGQSVILKTRWYTMAGDQVRVLFAEDWARPRSVSDPAPVPKGQPDVVIAADFGYGAVDPHALDQTARVAVMCQTNSQNFGTNVLTRRFQRAGMFVVDDRELRLAAHTNNPTRDSLSNVASNLHAERAYWTRGQESTISLCAGECHECPALEDRPMDPLGAGDAFFTVAALCWAAGVAPDLSLLLAQIAGAQLTRVLGNEQSLDRERLLRTAKAILA